MHGNGKVSTRTEFRGCLILVSSTSVSGLSQLSYLSTNPTANVLTELTKAAARQHLGS